MSLTSYRAAPPRVRGSRPWAIGSGHEHFCCLCLLPIAHCPLPYEEEGSVLCRPGDDLLSHVLRQSTIGAKAFDGRVRDGIGSLSPCKGHQAGKERLSAIGRR